MNRQFCVRPQFTYSRRLRGCDWSGCQNGPSNSSHDCRVQRSPLSPIIPEGTCVSGFQI